MNYIDKAKKYLELKKINLPAFEQERFFALCEANQLDPLLNDIYVIQSGYSNYCFVVSYNAYIKVADSQPKRAGEQFETTYDEEGNLKSVICTVYKFDENNSQYKFLNFEALLKEYTTRKSLWVSKPSVMLRKCAHVNALRQSYPTMFKGTVYIQEELDAESNTAPTPIATPAPSPALELTPTPVQPEPTLTKRGRPKKEKTEEPVEAFTFDNETVATTITPSVNQPTSPTNVGYKKADEIQSIDFFDQTNPIQQASITDFELEPQPIQPPVQPANPNPTNQNQEVLNQYKKLMTKVVDLKKQGHQQVVTNIINFWDEQYGYKGIPSMEGFGQLDLEIKLESVKRISEMVDGFLATTNENQILPSWVKDLE